MNRIAGRQALHFAKGEWVCRWGEDCAGVYVVQQGAVKLAYHAPGGPQKVLAIAGAGDSFGEATLFLGRRWLMSARALADCALLYVPARRIAEEIARDPGFAQRLLAGLSRRLSRLLGELAAQGACSGAERLAAYLLSSAAPGERAALELTLASKADVASHLGMSAEHFSRVLRKLRSSGLIEVRGRRVRVPDPQRLRAQF